MADNGDSAMTGGLLVILGIIVAIVAVVYFQGGFGGGDAPDIKVELPAKN